MYTSNYGTTLPRSTILRNFTLLYCLYGIIQLQMEEKVMCGLANTPIIMLDIHDFGSYTSMTVLMTGDI